MADSNVPQFLPVLRFQKLGIHAILFHLLPSQRYGYILAAPFQLQHHVGSRLPADSVGSIIHAVDLLSVHGKNSIPLSQASLLRRSIFNHVGNQELSLLLLHADSDAGIGLGIPPLQLLVILFGVVGGIRIRQGLNYRPGQIPVSFLLVDGIQ